MSYQTSDSKKEEFRKYLEKTGTIDGLVRALVTLYEENDKPNSPLDFIQKLLGAPSQVEFEALVRENEALKARIAELEAADRAKSEGQDGPEY